MDRSLAQLNDLARQDVSALVQRHRAHEARIRAAKNELDRQHRVKAAAPSWARFRAQQELERLVSEVASTGQVTDEHRAAYRRLDGILTGGQG